jgi:hypothetical protein
MAEDKVSRLAGILGFDPVKAEGAAGALADALEEINNERRLAARAKAKQLLTDAIGKAQKKQELDDAYRKESDKFEKDMGKLLVEIENLSK